MWRGSALLPPLLDAVVELALVLAELLFGESAPIVAATPGHAAGHIAPVGVASAHSRGETSAR